jgi:hypothetical protein
VETYDILEANNVFETLYDSSQSVPFAFLPIITFCCVIISIGILTMPEFKVIFVKKNILKETSLDLPTSLVSAFVFINRKCDPK